MSLPAHVCVFVPFTLNALHVLQTFVFLCCTAARSGCPPAPVLSVGVAFVGHGSAPADLPGTGEAWSPQDRTPGAHTGGRGEALLPGERGVMCVCVHSVSIAVLCVSKAALLCVYCGEGGVIYARETRRAQMFTKQSSSCLV